MPRQLGCGPPAAGVGDWSWSCKPTISARMPSAVAGRPVAASDSKVMVMGAVPTWTLAFGKRKQLTPTQVPPLATVCWEYVSSWKKRSHPAVVPPSVKRTPLYAVVFRHWSNTRTTPPKSAEATSPRTLSSGLAAVVSTDGGEISVVAPPSILIVPLYVMMLPARLPALPQRIRVGFQVNGEKSVKSALAGE